MSVFGLFGMGLSPVVILSSDDRAERLLGLFHNLFNRMPSSYDSLRLDTAYFAQLLYVTGIRFSSLSGVTRSGLARSG